MRDLLRHKLSPKTVIPVFSFSFWLKKRNHSFYSFTTDSFSGGGGGGVQFCIVHDMSLWALVENLD